MADNTPQEARLNSSSATRQDLRSLGRRILVLRVASLGAAAGTLAVPLATTAAAAPVVPAPQLPDAVVPVQGRSDNDPNDAPGRGIRGGYGGGGGRTDNDPNDSPGRGIRGGGYGGGRGVSDSDPYDGPGRGRGYSQPRSVTDNDPNDGPGRGRGWR
jgi:hypothetical protein